jgi:hypothetical protein
MHGFKHKLPQFYKIMKEKGENMMKKLRKIEKK